VRQGFVPVPVGMARTRVDRLIVRMLMVFVVHVLVFVFHLVMRMLVLVPFGYVQPDANPHQQRRQRKRDIHGFAKECHSD
jgi:hypothetical protein